MANLYDEISLSYWEKHKKKIGLSKSYSCFNNGYIYGDEMQCTSIEFVYKQNGTEEVLKGINDGPKWAYFKLVEKACSLSSQTLCNFINNQAEKFRIYTEQQVATFTSQQRNSTRIKDDSCIITVNNINYYVANNLKVCEYFNNASKNIDSTELNQWYIRIYFDSDVIKSMNDRDEIESVDDVEATVFVLNVQQRPIVGDTETKSAVVSNNAIVNVDYAKLNIDKKKTGDLGEAIVLNYEKQRLTTEGCPSLAEKIKHSALEKGDGLGYDIMSYLSDGKPLYIEVKTTKQNKPADFYLSKKEKAVADQMFKENQKYKIYRIYNLNLHTGKGDLVFYEPPFDDNQYNLEPENWLVRIK